MKDATISQTKQIIDLLARERNSHTFVQRLIERWGAVQMIGEGEVDQTTITAALRQVINPYAKERVESRFFYPKGWKPKKVADQIRILRSHYPFLGASKAVQSVKGITIPKDEDGLFAFPKPSPVASALGIPDPFGQGYGQLLEATVLAYLAARSRPFQNWRAGGLGPDHLRMRESTAAALRRLEGETPGDYLVFSAQTGKKYAGYSVRNSRWEIEHGGEEFPLPAWCVGNILLTHPERLAARKDLVIDCPGDEYRLGTDGEFGSALYFDFSEGKLYLGNYRIDDAYWKAGSAAGLLR